MANFKIYNFLNSLLRQPATRTQLTNEKYIPYFGDADNWPLEWHKSISESPSAQACVSTIADFLTGSGFSDKSLETKIVNPQQETFYQVHQRTCADYAEFEGFFWHFMYNSAGQITQWRVLPFENCRLGAPDDKGIISKIYYNPFFGTSLYDQNQKKNTIIYDVFNPENVRAQIGEQKEKFKGQVYYYGTTTAMSRFYPYPEATSAMKWMKIERGVSDYHEDNINNGFLQAFMLIMKGNPNEPSTNPEYSNRDKPITVAQEFDEVISSNFMGSKRVGNMFTYWALNSEEKPEILTIPSNSNGDLFVTIDNQATKKITIAFKVPSILANINEGVSLGGDGNTIRVAVKLMQQRVMRKQGNITDAYEVVFKNWFQPYTQEIVIAPYNPYPELEIIDDKIWDAMSAEEQRKWITENTDIKLIEAALPAAPIPNPTQARLQNAIPNEFPESVRATVKKAMDYHNSLGLKCSGRGALDMSDEIMNNEPMGLKKLKRIYNFLKKNAGQENKPYSDGCAVVNFNLWGGKPMMDYLESRLKDIETWLN